MKTTTLAGVAVMAVAILGTLEKANPRNAALVDAVDVRSSIAVESPQPRVDGAAQP